MLGCEYTCEQRIEAMDQASIFESFNDKFSVARGSHSYIKLGALVDAGYSYKQVANHGQGLRYLQMSSFDSLSYSRTGTEFKIEYFFLGKGEGQFIPLIKRDVGQSTIKVACVKVFDVGFSCKHGTPSPSPQMEATKGLFKWEITIPKVSPNAKIWFCPTAGQCSKLN